MDIKLEQEQYYGNIEYKYKLINLDNEKLNKRLTQLKFRLNEGGGEAFYHIGRMDDGTPLGLNKEEYVESVNNLLMLSTRLNCKLISIYENIKNDSHIGEFMVREIDNIEYVDLKIGVAGNVDAGKSTTIGTLTKGVLDDGRGKARLHVFNYKHEIDSGRTSSIGHQIMGFDIDGTVINSKYDKQPTWEEIVKQSSKIITFYDLAGHERYLKTTIYGLTSIYPDYCLIMIGANMGLNHMTKEHISLCLTLKIPIIFIISKIDIVPQNVLDETIQKINNIIKVGAKKVPYHIKKSEDLVGLIRNIKKDTIIPVIQISNVSAFNLDLLKQMLNILPIRNNYIQNIDKPVEFLIDNTYSVLGHSTIVSGVLRSGLVKVGDQLAIGPFSDSTYRTVKVRSLHCKCKNVVEAYAGLYICISLKNINRNEIRKGMVVVTDNTECKIVRKEFTALVHILHSPTTIKIGYQPFVHVDQIRQSVKLIHIEKLNVNTKINNIDNVDNDDNVLRTGDRANIKFVFVAKPEYIKPDMKLIFREGKVKAVGKVIN